MSADNWAICPKCKKMVETSKQKQIDKVMASYGKVPAEDYEAALIASKEPIDLRETLREDYEFCMETDGRFSASYSAHCDRCGFKHSFEHVEQVKI